MFKFLLLFIFINNLFYINTSTSCEPGYYITVNGCAPYAAGYYSSEEDMEYCDNCKSGTFSKSAATECTHCPEGTYSEVTSSVCIPSPAGEFSSKKGSNQCTSCPRGKFSKSGSSECENCPPGTFSW